MPEVFRYRKIRVCVDRGRGGKHSEYHFHVFMPDGAVVLSLYTLEPIVGRGKIPRDAMEEIVSRHEEIVDKWEEWNPED
jgi:hypothetical protein